MSTIIGGVRTLNEASADIDSEKEILDNIRDYAKKLSKETYTLAMAHFYRANLWAQIHLATGVISTIFSVFAGASLLSGSQSSFRILQFSIKSETLAGLLALVASALMAVTTFLKPHKQEQDYLNAARSFLSISNKARVFYGIESIMRNKTKEQLKELKDELSALLKEKYEQDVSSPRVPAGPWERAKRHAKKHFALAGETFYITIKVKDMPITPIPSVKLTCSGGCGDEVWVNKRVKRIWSKVPVLCMECALKKMDSARASKEDISYEIAPESIESLMKFFMERDKSHKS